MGDALSAVQAHQGKFANGWTPPALLRLLEWFVDPPCEMRVFPSFGGPPGPTYVSECNGDSLRFVGFVHDPNVSGEGGWLVYDLHLTPGAERVHLELFKKVPHTGATSLRPHLRRAYLAFVRAGITALELEAGLQSGPTFWAYAGVQFEGGRPLLAHLEAVAGLLTGAGTPPSLTSPKDVLDVYPGETATILEAYVTSASISKSWVQPPGHLVHMRDNLKIAIDAPMPVGAAILFAISPWNGRVDLTDPGTSDAGYRAFLRV